MKRLRLLAIGSLLLAITANSQTTTATKTVNKTISGNALTEDLTVPSGKTLTVANGGTLTVPAAALPIAATSGLQAALDAKLNAASLATVATTGAYSDLTGKPSLGGAASLNIGTTTGTVAAGDDSRIVGALPAATAATTYQPLEIVVTTTQTITPAANGAKYYVDGTGITVNFTDPSSPAPGFSYQVTLVNGSVVLGGLTTTSPTAGLSSTQLMMLRQYAVGAWRTQCIPWSIAQAGTPGPALGGSGTVGAAGGFLTAFWNSAITGNGGANAASGTGNGGAGGFIASRPTFQFLGGSGGGANGNFSGGAGGTALVTGNTGLITISGSSGGPAGAGGAGGAGGSVLTGGQARMIAITAGIGGAGGAGGAGGSGGSIGTSSSANLLSIQGGAGGAGGSSGGSGGNAGSIFSGFSSGFFRVVGGSGGAGGSTGSGGAGGGLSGTNSLISVTTGNGGAGGIGNGGAGGNAAQLITTSGGAGGTSSGAGGTGGAGGSAVTAIIALAGNGGGASNGFIGGSGGNTGFIGLSGGAGANDTASANGGAGGSGGTLTLNGASASGTTAGGKGGVITLNGLVGLDAANILCGSGSPEGVTTAPVSSIFLRMDGAAGTAVYSKVTGTGNTGWVAMPDATSLATALAGYETLGSSAAAQAAAIAASQPRATSRVVTTSGALTAADAVIVCTGAGGITLTLPAANAASPRPVQLEIINRTSGTVTLSRAGSDLFEGDTSALITTGASWSITSDASANWYLY